MEQVALDHFLRGLPDDERRVVGMKVVQLPRDMVAALQCELVTLEMGRGGKRTGLHSSISPATFTARILVCSVGHRRTPRHNHYLRTSQCLRRQSTTQQLGPINLGCWDTLFIIHHNQAEQHSNACTPGFGEHHHSDSSLGPDKDLLTPWKPGHQLCAWGCERGPYCRCPDRGPKR